MSGKLRTWVKLNNDSRDDRDRNDNEEKNKTESKKTIFERMKQIENLYISEFISSWLRPIGRPEPNISIPIYQTILSASSICFFLKSRFQDCWMRKLRGKSETIIKVLKPTKGFSQINKIHLAICDIRVPNASTHCLWSLPMLTQVYSLSEAAVLAHHAHQPRPLRALSKHADILSTPTKRIHEARPLSAPNGRAN